MSVLARRPTYPLGLPPQRSPYATPPLEGLLDTPTAMDWGLVAAIAWLAYKAGQNSAAKKKTPGPTLGAVLGGYAGLRAMDKLFGR